LRRRIVIIIRGVSPKDEIIDERSGKQDTKKAFLYGDALNLKLESSVILLLAAHEKRNVPYLINFLSR
jgi:hypothetical protein